jgi:hypothetical protein
LFSFVISLISIEGWSAGWRVVRQPRVLETKTLCIFGKEGLTGPVLDARQGINAPAPSNQIAELFRNMDASGIAEG